MTDVFEIHRMTTSYLEIEDRFRVAGETRDGNVIGLWLTQRLLLRVLPYLFKWLEKQTQFASIPAKTITPQATAMVQSVAQQQAQQALQRQTLQKPVPADIETDFSLVKSVDLSSKQGKIRITFNLTGNSQAVLLLTSQQLRQWLTIISRYWKRSRWPNNIWPDWMIEEGSTQNNGIIEAVH